MHRSSRVRVRCLAAALLVGSALMSSVLPMAAMARQVVYTIGVDNAGPTGHDFEYVDFFPRDGLKVTSQDVLHFNWNAMSSDGAHTVSFLPRGVGLPPLAIPEPGSDEPGLQFNPAIVFPTNPTCGETASNPCLFDGSQAVSSGFIANGNPSPPYLGDFYVQLDSSLLQGASSADVKYVCEIHPGMAATVTLVANAQDASDPAAVKSAAASQLDDDTKGALNAERSANSTLVVHNADGTSNITMTAGTSTNYVEVVEMLPNTLRIKPGDTVTWATKSSKDPHTVTFPRGHGSDAIDPLPAGCEAGAGADTPPSADGPPCANLADFEVALVPQPIGSSAITDPRQASTSGVIGNPAEGFPMSTSFTFPTAGSFDYQCRIHDGMVGLVVVH